jgi:ribosomal protein S18 acetylase RimI-like enzyme
MNKDYNHICIKEAGFKDIVTIQSVMNKVWPQTYASIISQEQINYMIDWMYSTESLRQQIKDGQHFWILEKNNEPVGYGSFSRTENWNTYKIHKLYIAEFEQRSGLGAQLLNKFIHLIKGNQGRFIQLQVNRENHKAISFYKKHGFEILKSVNFDIGNGYFMDDYIMQKNL